MEPDIREEATQLRDQCVRLERQTRRLNDHHVFRDPPDYDGQHPEMHAQIMLAVRHLEDARMRLGKLIQYADGAVSIYESL